MTSSTLARKKRYTRYQMQAARVQAKPFMKWAGGKGRLLPQLRPFFPSDFTNYYEPFFGGGAVFFSLDITGVSHINDINDTLTDAYSHVKSNVSEIISELQKLENTYLQLEPFDRQEFYYEQRDRFNSLGPGIERTVLLIFLNKTCFNGLYRENRKGEFNVPFGRYTNPTICDTVNLQAVSTRLQNTVITAKPYSAAIKDAIAGDFVYFDPPYMPLNATSSFTAYHETGFTAEDQTQLRDLFIELDKRGCFVMLSNSSAPLMLELYKDFKQHFVQAARAINATGSGRSAISELVVTNY